MILEEWKFLKYQNQSNYEISSHGRIRSKRKAEMVFRYHEFGYPQVELRIEGRRKLCNIHKLVAEHFIPNPLSLPIINHIDGNPLNNKVINLEWCTQSHNINVSEKHKEQARQSIVDARKSLPLDFYSPERQSARAISIRVQWEHSIEGSFFGSATELYKLYPILNRSCLYRVLHRTSNNHRGWTISYN